MTEGQGVNVVIDCVGAEETIRDSIRILSKGGVLVVVGLFGNQIKMPLVQSVINEYQVRCSLWGNYNELREVIELAKQHKIKHNIHKCHGNVLSGRRGDGGEQAGLRQCAANPLDFADVVESAGFPSRDPVHVLGVDGSETRRSEARQSGERKPVSTVHVAVMVLVSRLARNWLPMMRAFG